MAIVCKPLTPARWKDFEALFSGDRTCSGCWCVWNRVSAAEYRAGWGAANKRRMKAIVDSGEVPGLLAYDGREPVGWAAVGPRETYKRLERSKVCAPPDDEPAWSLPCFFTGKRARGQGVSVALLKAAAAYAKKKGARLLEGYPVDPKGKKQPAGFVWWGLAPAFRKAGFSEVLRRSKTRPFMRKAL